MTTDQKCWKPTDEQRAEWAKHLAEANARFERNNANARRRYAARKAAQAAAK
ncbi:MAG TPA: hypothetical protein VM915_07380 [Verrucomicrobiae bacterium]|jgi:hypothetical protein|nr:hypothetical protein [Verrucomicrobiae bacterium]